MQAKMCETIIRSFWHFYDQRLSEIVENKKDLQLENFWHFGFHSKSENGSENNAANLVPQAPN